MKKQTHCDSAKMAEAFSTQKAKPTDETSSHYNQAVENSIRNPPVGYIFYIISNGRIASMKTSKNIIRFSTVLSRPSLSPCFAVEEVYSHQIWINWF